jgi:hypothetical protein
MDFYGRKTPPTNEWVLVSTMHNDVRIMEFYEDQKWGKTITGLGIPYPVDYVTHWMLLPKPAGRMSLPEQTGKDYLG